MAAALYTSIRHSIFALAKERYQIECGIPAPSFDTTGACPVGGTSTTHHHHHHHGGSGVVIDQSTRVYNTPPAPKKSNKKKDDDDKEEKGNKVGGIVVGGLVGTLASYLLASEYVEYCKIKEIDDDLGKLVLVTAANPQAVPGSQAAVESLVRAWTSWRTYASSCNSYYLFTKGVGLASGALLATGVYTGDAYWLYSSLYGAAATSIAAVGITTLYHGMWKATERKRMQIVLQALQAHDTLANMMAFEQ